MKHNSPISQLVMEYSSVAVRAYVAVVKGDTYKKS